VGWFVAGSVLLLTAVIGVAARADEPSPDKAKAGSMPALFARDNLIAWCIVPFDSKNRPPEERAAMLERLGFKHFAYDWRAEHIPSFDAEVEALKRHGVSLDAFWVAPGELNRESRIILDLLKRHKLKTQLWVLLDLGPDRVTGAEQERRVEAAAAKLGPLAKEADAIGCSLALYNHGGWFGEPENQLAIIERLKGQGVTNVGIVYNLHHGHEHLDRFREILEKIKPHLVALNLNGMDPGGDQIGRKILPLGQGELDLELLKIILASGYHGPIGILGHTMDDAEARLKDNLDGLDWLVPQLEGKPAGPKPVPRTPVPPRPEPQATATHPQPSRPIQGPVPAIASAPSPALTKEEQEQLVQLIEEAKTQGNPKKGAEVFASAAFACISCHRVGGQGGLTGPELTTIGICSPPEQIVESVLWPRRTVKEGFAAIAVATDDGRVLQGYTQSENEHELVLREAATQEIQHLEKRRIEERRDQGTLMPEGLLASMSPSQRRDLVRFLLDLGRPESAEEGLVELVHAHAPASFSYDRRPLHPEDRPSWQEPVNRDRLYDFYAKEAEHFRRQNPVPMLLPAFPGLDGGQFGHWGNQNEDTWVDGRWNQADLGRLLSGIFRGAGETVPKGVCVRLGDRGEMAACFNPLTLTYDAVWTGGFVRFSSTRHGFLDGLLLDGSPLPKPDARRPDGPFVYHGFYRHGARVVFSYRIGDTEWLDSPWVENGQFIRTVGPAETHPLRDLTQGGPSQWPQVLRTQGKRGNGRPYAIDTIEPPFENPWKVPLFFGDHDFLPDGSALICTMQGDVWRVEGLDDDLTEIRWRRFASGLNQALGLLVSDGQIYVLGRDQLTRLHDLNSDGEADFYECVNNRYETSPAGHDFICGLQRDAAGSFYSASGKDGVLKIAPDGSGVSVVATGFRNPDGLGLTTSGAITVPCSEGEWTPASMICEIRPGGHYGYTGPRDNQPPDLPLVYIPRGLDNSSGAQVEVSSQRWGPLEGQLVHLSFGMGTWFVLLRDEVGGQPQGALVPMPGEFTSGAHRGRFNPKDGQLYVSGMAGWGSYTLADGCFQRVRYTGDPVQTPLAYHAHENGVLLEFSAPLNQAAEQAGNHFAQAWNYRYSSGYGSLELSPRHPGMPGHDPLAIRSAHILADGRSLFLEIPDLQPVNQLHLLLNVAGEDSQTRPVELFATVHKLAAPFTGFPGYRPEPKTIAAHPILADMVALAAKPIPNPWAGRSRGAKAISIEAGKNLTFSVRSFTVKAGETIELTFANPDVVPHNWALVRPESLSRVGDLVNKIVAEPDAALRSYIPRTDDILVYTDIVQPSNQFTISFKAPTEKGRYPYLCTFPGHWMVMNGLMIVE
jgi:putative heme-binding domain-containing protein